MPIRELLITVSLAMVITACAKTAPAPTGSAVAPPSSASQAMSAPSAPNGRVTGTVRSADPGAIVLQDGEEIVLGPNATLIKSAPVDPTTIGAGDFVAVTAQRQDDGTLLASVVNIFPESMRGLGIGQRPMTDGNLMTNATVDEVGTKLMTNATVEDVNPQTFSVTFPDGSDTVELADDAKVNQFESASTDDLTPGTAISAQVNNGTAQFVTIM